MKLDRRNIIVLVLVAISILAWVLRKMNILYIPGLTAVTLAIAMALVGLSYIAQRDRTRKIIGVLIVAFGMFNVVVAFMEIYTLLQA